MRVVEQQSQAMSRANEMVADHTSPAARLEPSLTPAVGRPAQLTAIVHALRSQPEPPPRLLALWHQAERGAREARAIPPVAVPFANEQRVSAAFD